MHQNSPCFPQALLLRPASCPSDHDSERRILRGDERPGESLGVDGVGEAANKLFHLELSSSHKQTAFEIEDIHIKSYYMIFL